MQGAFASRPPSSFGICGTINGIPPAEFGWFVGHIIAKNG
jgi:hypothetical protein